MVGTVLVLGCVALISIGGSTQSGDIDTKYLVLAIGMAVITGLNLSLNTLNIQYVIDSGFDVDQSNYDAALIVAVLYMPFIILYRNEFDIEVYGISSISVILGTLGVICISRALKYGNAGPVQAIENSKTII